MSGREAEALEAVEFLEGTRKSRYVAPTHLAWPYIGLGDFDRAFELLEEALEERDFLVLYLETYPTYEPIRMDPRYPALRAKVLEKSREPA